MTLELDAVLAESLARLAEAGENPGSPWRNLALATVGLDGNPRVRTLVLRRVEAAKRLLELHTDSRSAKHGELAVRPVASLHGWDADSRVQICLSGPVSLHQGDPVAEAGWNALRPASRNTYRLCLPPGTPVTEPDCAAHANDEAARAVFCVIRLRFIQLEYLHLGQGSHRRARFQWENGRPQAMWLVP